MQTLDFNTLPLEGLRLIEASAGTGKTFTIAEVYVRLITGDTPQGHAYAVENILVVTFTEAATQELRTRIRTRLAEALLTPPQVHDQPDTLIQKRIELALASMDQASIMTIHGFAKRMLDNTAFESGMLFNALLDPNTDTGLPEACQDYWRTHIAALPMADYLFQKRLVNWTSPDALAETFRKMRRANELPSTPVLEELPALEQGLSNLHQQLLADWQTDQEELIAFYRNLKGYQVHGGKIKAIANFLPWFIDILTPDHALMDFLAYQPDKLFQAGYEHLHVNARTKAANRLPPPDKPFMHSLDQLLEAIDVFTEQKTAHLLKDFFQFTQQHVRHHKLKRGTLTFDDLVQELDYALQQPDTGAELAQQIRGQFPVALIDEFQDTDDAQFSIFSRLYATDEHFGNLLMIGDPKQAIYRFRGADIYTYLRAKQLAHPSQGAHRDQYTMGMNWRSSKEMVEMLNHLFQMAGPSPFLDDDIPFHSMQASTRAPGAFTLNGQAQSALSLTYVTGEEGKALERDSFKWQCARDCANKIAEWLSLSDQGHAALGDAPLQAADIAVLVRSAKEGDLVKAALNRAGVRSQFNSKTSVLDTQEARWLLQWLEVMIRPDQEAKVKGLLSTPLYGLSADKVDALASAPLEWQAYLSGLTDDRRRLEINGPLTSLLSLLFQQQSLTRLRHPVLGDRSITNLLHIAQLLDEQWQQHASPYQLADWLSQGMQGSLTDAPLLQVESNENIVTIQTIHSSKGLEYGIVVLPFLWDAIAPSRSGEMKPPRELLENQHRTIALQTKLTPEQQQSLYIERIAEDMRLLYVALTRAVYHLHLHWGIAGTDLNAQHAPLGCLLTPQHWQSDFVQEKALSLCPTIKTLLETPATLTQALTATCSQLPNTDYQSHSFDAFSELPNVHFRPQSSSTEYPDAPPPPEQACRPTWHVSSFSSLTHHDSPYVPNLPDHQLSQHEDKGEADTLGHQQSILNEKDARFDYPKGAVPGDVLHDILEHRIGTPMDVETFETLIENTFRKHHLSYWSETEQSRLRYDNIEGVKHWLHEILATPMTTPEGMVSLDQLDKKDCLPEMAFQFRTDAINSPAINRFLSEQFPDVDLAQADFKSYGYQGHLKGFIDLIFQHQGRYYVVDYKGNFLGDQLMDYQSPNMETAILQHQYYLQYNLYMVALHRLLKSRLAHYDPQFHLGGVRYLFLRGMHSDNQQPLGIYTASLLPEQVLTLNQLLGDAE